MSTASNNAGDPILDLNTTPLIDVMLVLLILFIVTLPLATHITKLDLPGAGPPVEREVVRLDIDFDGVVVWNGAVVANMEELSGRMRSAAARDVQPLLRVEPAARVEYDRVAHVLARAQRSGLRHIAIGGGER